MITFMILALPRSGTCWAANWLTTETKHCIHEPLWHSHYTRLDEIKSNKKLGVACTGLALFPDWVNQHPAKKVILHRGIKEINSSLLTRGMATLSESTPEVLDKIIGFHCDWRCLFDTPDKIYEHLFNAPLDKERHEMLKTMNVQENLEYLKPNVNGVQKIIKELRGD